MRGRILVVDDDPTILAIVETVLETEYDVDTVISGTDAVSRLKDGDYDVLVCDLVMPGGVSGQDVLEAVRRHAPDTVAVVLTGHGSVDAAVESLRAGAWDFVSKPVDSLELARVVRRCVERRRELRRSSLQNAAHAVFSTVEASELPYAIVEMTVDVMRGAQAVLFAADGDAALLRPLHRSGSSTLDDATWDRIAHAVSVNLEPAVLGDGGAVALPFGVGSVVAHPLIARNHLFGVLGVARLSNQPVYGLSDLHRLSILASQASLAMDNAWLAADLEQRTDALQRAHRTLTSSQRLEGVGELATRLAHDLQAPASTLQTHLRAITEILEARDDPALREVKERLRYAEAATQAIARAAGDLSRLSRDRTDVEFDLEQAVDAAMRRFRGRDLVEMSELPAATVRGNARQVSQAILNLLENAHRAIRDVEEGRIELRGEISDGHVRVEIEDNGIGIEQADMDWVFKPFVTAWSEGTSAGLGLSTASEVARRHGGDLTLRSTPGRGTIAAITFALAEGGGLLVFGDG